jgi:hypothetical protein
MMKQASALPHEWHFEQGPIRPPSEARSLLLRVSRNCPWNRCTFCPVYKGRKFSMRSVEEVCRDIDAVARHLDLLRRNLGETGVETQGLLQLWHDRLPSEERTSFRAAAHWLAGGLQSVFLQDADGLVIGPSRLRVILAHLQTTFPWTFRITAYTRSQTVLRFSLEELMALRTSGLTRLHIGMESGCDAVLEKVCKGATRAMHIQAGQRVKQAGIELSEYVMPGLGGRTLSEPHARDSATALNAIRPDFIRLRTLAIPEGIPLHAEWLSGRFEPCTSVEVAGELLLFLQTLDGITAELASDHVLNLFEDLAGILPGDQPRLLAMVQAFLDLTEERRCVYLIGRRGGVLRGLQDLNAPEKEAAAQALCLQLGADPDNVEELCRRLMQGFI